MPKKTGPKPKNPSELRNVIVRTYHTASDISIVGGIEKAQSIAATALAEAVKKKMKVS